MAFPTADLFARYEALLHTGQANNSQPGQLPDYSGGGRNLFTGSAPGRYRTNIVNGKPAYYFDGNGYYQASSLDYPAISSLDSAVTISAIVNSSTAGTTRSWPFGTTESESTSIFAFTDGSTSGQFGYFLRGAVNPNQQAIPSGTDTVWTVLTMVLTPSAVSVYRNGTLVRSHANSGALQRMDRIRLASIVNNNYEGYVAGAFIWKRGLSQSERAEYHSYVQDTYAISVSDYLVSDAPPTATIYSPTQEQRFQVGAGPIALVADAFDDVGLAGVGFVVDPGAIYFEAGLNNELWTAEIPAGYQETGTWTVTAYALDSANQQSASDPITFYIDDGVIVEAAGSLPVSVALSPSSRRRATVVGDVSVVARPYGFPRPRMATAGDLAVRVVADPSASPRARTAGQLPTAADFDAASRPSASASADLPAVIDPAPGSSSRTTATGSAGVTVDPSGLPAPRIVATAQLATAIDTLASGRPLARAAVELPVSIDTPTNTGPRTSAGGSLGLSLDPDPTEAPRATVQPLSAAQVDAHAVTRSILDAAGMLGARLLLDPSTSASEQTTRAGEAAVTVSIAGRPISVARTTGAVGPLADVHGTAHPLVPATSASAVLAALETLTAPVGRSAGTLAATASTNATVTPLATSWAELEVEVVTFPSTGAGGDAHGVLAAHARIDGAAIPSPDAAGTLQVEIVVAGDTYATLTATGQLPVLLDVDGVAVNPRAFRDITITMTMSTREVDGQLTARRVRGSLHVDEGFTAELDTRDLRQRLSRNIISGEMTV